MKKFIFLAVAFITALFSAPSYASESNLHNGWLHGFYAFSSYGQRELIKDMNAVTFGWSVMEWDEENGARLNTTAQNGNAWRVPDSYEMVADYPGENGVSANLGVYMDDSTGLVKMLSDADCREAAANEILNIKYEFISGVTIDFEGLSGERERADFNAFLKTLSDGLRAGGLELYVAVHPVISDGQYFDGYDYKTIGELADKVILMAHDYQPESLEGFEGTEWYKNAALTPIDEIETAVAAITDSESGVADTGKIALAYNFSAVGWMLDGEGKIASAEPVVPLMETVVRRMRQADTVFGWSEEYRNPYMIYRTENGERVFMWYEDSRSVKEKIILAERYGITGASVWRLGIVPDVPEWNIWDCFTE